MIPRAWLRRARAAVRAAAALDLDVRHAHAHGCYDRVRVERCGLIRLEGWDRRDVGEIDFPTCTLGGEEAPFLEAFRIHRPDVASSLGTDDQFRGVSALYRVTHDRDGAKAELSLRQADRVIFTVEGSFPVAVPDYAPLLDTAEVLHRGHIYGSGPPASTVASEVEALARPLGGPLLDFGCGGGALVSLLRGAGVEAYGIEIDREPVVTALPPGVRDFVTLYDGAFPLPFPDERFESATAIEVLEHVPDYDGAVAELARVTRVTLLVTVPDMSAIPIGHHNAVVPWHLMESTHVNFFTQASLTRVLSAHFPRVEIARIAPMSTNGAKWFESLAAICRK